MAATVLASNRDTNLSEFRSPLKARSVFKIDRVSISFQVAEYEHNMTEWTSFEQKFPNSKQETQQRTEELFISGGRKVYFSVSTAPHGDWGRLDFNPSKPADDSCPIALLNRQMREAWDSALQLAKPLYSLEEALLKRLDLCRDFVVSDTATYLRGLAEVPVSWAKRKSLHSTPHGNRPQTLRIGSGSGCVLLYDKSQQDPSYPSGTLRWELQARHRWIRRYGDVNTFGDLSLERIDAFAMNRWEWSKMKTPVTTMPLLMEEIEKLDWSETRKEGLLGHLVRRSHGIPTKISREREREYRQFLELHGVPLMDVAVPDWACRKVRLDVCTGNEVADVA